jgi:hypothetical protein
MRVPDGSVSPLLMLHKLRPGAHAMRRDAVGADDVEVVRRLYAAVNDRDMAQQLPASHPMPGGPWRAGAPSPAHTWAGSRSTTGF